MRSFLKSSDYAYKTSLNYAKIMASKKAGYQGKLI